MMLMKEREMNVAAERMAILRHIASELWTMFRVRCDAEIATDPVWHPTEKPETIITVTDEETSVKPYVTPEEQEIIDRERITAARETAELRSDDFREKMLMETMDGLLEVR